MSVWQREEIQTVLRAEENRLKLIVTDKMVIEEYRIKKEVNKVVLLDELKSRLTAYEEPLKDLRDSL